MSCIFLPHFHPNIHFLPNPWICHSTSVYKNKTFSYNGPFYISDTVLHKWTSSTTFNVKLFLHFNRIWVTSGVFNTLGPTKITVASEFMTFSTLLKVTIALLIPKVCILEAREIWIEFRAVKNMILEFTGKFSYPKLLSSLQTLGKMTAGNVLP